MRFQSMWIAATGGMLVLAVGGCALPRDRMELLRAEPPAAAGTPARSAPAAVPTDSARNAAPSGSAPSGGSAPVPAADGGVAKPMSAMPVDASMPSSAGPDECGDELAACLFANPFDFQACASKYCRALVPVDAGVVVADGGLTKEAACAMQFADCLTRSPGMTAQCMAKAQQCM